MLETIQNFESAVGPVARDYPLFVIAPASAGVVAGLFVWLGGLGFKRVLMAIAGAVGGAAVGQFALGWGLVPTVISAGVAAVIAAVLDRVFIAQLAATLVAAISFVVLIGPNISIENVQMERETQYAAVDSNERMERLNAYLIDAGSKVRKASSEVPVYQWVIAGVLTVVFLVGGFVFRRFSAALCFSVLGTLFIVAGMIMLLLYKGATPLSWIGQRPLRYAGIVGGMVVFGTIVQLLFCRGGVVKSAKKPNAEGGDDASGRKRRWTE
jgi:hypothetical protein